MAHLPGDCINLERAGRPRLRVSLQSCRNHLSGFAMSPLGVVHVVQGFFLHLTSLGVDSFRFKLRTVQYMLLPHTGNLGSNLSWSDRSAQRMGAIQ